MLHSCSTTGDPKVPFLKTQDVFFYLCDDLGKEQDRVPYFFGTHGPLYKFYIFTHDHL